MILIVNVSRLAWKQCKVNSAGVSLLAEATSIIAGVFN
jgi:hypothetical protein